MAKGVFLLKKQLGKFFTKINVFKYLPFQEWISQIPNFEDRLILEPFAGNMDLIYFLQEIGIKNKYQCFDIVPENENVIQNDSIKNFPKYKDCVVITNPPYLAKISSTRLKLDYENKKYNNLYLECLSIMLKNSEFVCVIIPESFITSGLFHERLFSIASLNEQIFEDTDCPVCLAMFNGSNKFKMKKDFKIYIGNDYLNTYQNLVKISESILNVKKSNKIKFNVPDGNIGLYAIDSTKEDSIRFVLGNEIENNKIKVTSRSITKILIDREVKQVDIDKMNNLLNKWRKETGDVFLTSFKGLRQDGKYRRRLSFDIANQIIRCCLGDK